MAFQDNKALYSIPAAYVLCQAPHAYAYGRMLLATKFQWSNVTPRENWETFKSKVPHEVFQRCLRAQHAHYNGFEGFPLFAAAIIAGSGRVSQQDLQTMAWEYLGVRTLYNLVYIGVRNEAASYLRTGLWAWSLALPIITLVKSAKAYNNV